MALLDWAGKASKLFRGAIVWKSLTGGAGPAPAVGPWYEDATLGNDGNIGNTSLLPWKTVAQAAGNTFPSDTINWKFGESWREYWSEPPTTQTWQGYGTPGTPWKLSCMDVVVGIWTNVGGTVWSTPYTTILPSVTGVDVDGVHYPIAASLAAILLGQCFYNAATDVLYLDITGGDSTMSGKVVEANGQRLRCVSISTGQGGYRISGGYFHGGTDGTFVVQNGTAPSSWTSCRFGHGGAINSVGLLFLQEGNQSGNAVTDCLFDNGNTDCLFINDNPSAVVSFCTFNSLYGAVSDHVQFGGTVTGGSGGSVVHHCYHSVQNDTGSTKGAIVVSGNLTTGAFIFRDNFADGGNYMVSFGNSTDTGQNSHQILRNISVNTLAGSSLGSFGNGCPADSCSWLFNVSLNSAITGFNFFGGVNHTNVTVVNNTVFGFALRGITCGNASDKLSGKVECNIFWGTASTSNQMRLVDGVPAQTLTSDYNDFGPVKTAFVSYNGTTYNTLALYRAGASQDAHSLATDPLLNTAVNRTASYGRSSVPVAVSYADVSPTALSPIRGVGLRIVGVNDSLPNPPDMGAFQFGATGPGIPAPIGSIGRRRQRVLAIVKGHGAGGRRRK